MKHTRYVKDELTKQYIDCKIGHDGDGYFIELPDKFVKEFNCTTEDILRIEYTKSSSRVTYDMELVNKQTPVTEKKYMNQVGDTVEGIITDISPNTNPRYKNQLIYTFDDGTKIYKVFGNIDLDKAISDDMRDSYWKVKCIKVKIHDGKPVRTYDVG